MREGRSVERGQGHKLRTGGGVVLRRDSVEGGERTSSGPSRPAFASSRTEHRCSGPPVGRSLPVESSQRVSVVRSTRKQTVLGTVKGGSASSTSHLAWASLPPPPGSNVERTFSIANSSSALTCISRAFSRASWLMKATCLRAKARAEGKDRMAERRVRALRPKQRPWG